MKLEDIHKLYAQELPPRSALSPGQVREILQTMGYDPDNFYQELEMSSPWVDTHRDISYSNAQMQLHSHDFYEILYCCSNCDLEYLIGADRYRLRRGDVVFVAPGVSHRPLLPENMSEPYKRYVLWLSTEFMELYTEKFLSGTRTSQLSLSLFRTGGTRWEILGEYFRRGVEEAELQQQGWEAFLAGNTISLLTLLGRAVSERPSSLLKAEKPILLDQVMAYLETHLAEKISLNTVAKQFYVSTSTISQVFHQKMGVSFYHYVTQRRLIAAKTRIEQGIRLEDAGHQVGFADYSTFYRAFKKEFGISPRQYRKLQLTED